MTNRLPYAFTPASNPTAQQLLPSKRCRQIEIWLDETIQYESLQTCATDKLHGHVSDAPVLSSGGASRTPPTFLCPVCNKPVQVSAALPHATLLTSPSSISLSRKYTTKPRSVLRGLKIAMAPFSRNKLGNKNINSSSEQETCDPALSTKMFLMSPAGEDKGNHNKNHHQKRKDTQSPPSSSSAPSFAKLGSSHDDDNDGMNKLLNERMARLKRAQKLLEKGQKKG